MTRISMIALAASVLALAACQPQKTPEQIQAEQAAAALQQMGAMFGANGQGQPTPEQMAAAITAAGSIASADASLTPEERAKLQAITGAMASGNVHPAASAYLTGANKALALLGTAKDQASVNALKPQLSAIYAEMAGPAATLKGMSEDERDVAFGSAMPQMLAMSTGAMQVMSKLSYDPQTMELVSGLLDQMPQVD